MRLELRNASVRVAEPPAIDTPASAGGLDVDDEVRQMGGVRMTSPEDVNEMLRRHRPGDVISVVFVDRTGAEKQTSVTLREDPGVELLPVEMLGRVLAPSQRTFRQRWLN
jgi:S1-C subfamily serine protease